MEGHWRLIHWVVAEGPRARLIFISEHCPPLPGRLQQDWQKQRPRSLRVLWAWPSLASEGAGGAGDAGAGDTRQKTRDPEALTG